MIGGRLLGVAVLACLVAGGAPAALGAQQKYKLDVTGEREFTSITLTSEGAALSDIAADLATRLRVPVLVGSSLQKEPVFVTFSDSALEPALRSLALRSLVDYELRQNASAAPQGIYLLGAADPDPATDAIVRGPSMGLMISGHTEEFTDPAKEEPIRVIGDRNRISIVVKQQPLEVVLMAVSETLGVPVEVKSGGAEIIEVNMAGVSAEEALVRLSPHVRVYVRANLSRVERTLLRVIVDPKAK